MTDSKCELCSGAIKDALLKHCTDDDYKYLLKDFKEWHANGDHEQTIKDFDELFQGRFLWGTGEFMKNLYEGCSDEYNTLKDESIKQCIDWEAMWKFSGRYDYDQYGASFFRSG